ncbi:hypothetical protein SLA2020_434120 [Shorea laevis]
MLSFQAPIPPNPRKTIPEVENSSNKRKRPEESHTSTEETLEEKRLKSLFDIELHLETPLPLEWQRCLDIQSGQIHFYNTRTHKRTSRDPRRSPEPLSPGDHHHHHNMSLDLDLNLSCDSLMRKSNNEREEFMTNKKQQGSLPWLTVREEEEEDQQQPQMVAMVCTRCHMLVMLCKSSPACPNCKFMHRPEEGYEPKLFKQRLSLYCFADPITKL